MYPQSFLSTLQENKQIFSKNKACKISNFFLQVKKKYIYIYIYISDQCWYLVVFGSRSVLFGVLLIKTLPSKYISQIRLGKYNYKKKITEEGPLKKTKKEEEEEEDFQRMTKEKRDLRARRGLQQHEDERNEGACVEQRDEMRGMKCWGLCPKIQFIGMT